MIKIDAKPQHGFVQGEWAAETQECADHKCTRSVKKGDACFIDMQSSAVYCDDCGKCKRFIRKRRAAAAAECN